MFSKIKLLLASIIIFNGHIYTSEEGLEEAVEVPTATIYNGLFIIQKICFVSSDSWPALKTRIIDDLNDRTKASDKQIVDVEINIRDLMGSDRPVSFKRHTIKGQPYINLLKASGVITKPEVYEICEIIEPSMYVLDGTRHLPSLRLDILFKR